MEFTERMELGRDQAALRRHRGLSSGKAAAGWDAKPAPAPERGSWSESVAIAKSAWQFAKGGFLQDYLQDVFPERFECDDIPF